MQRDWRKSIEMHIGALVRSGGGCACARGEPGGRSRVYRTQYAVASGCPSRFRRLARRM